MLKFEENLVSRVSGALQPMLGVQVTVTASNGLLATLYADDESTVLANPATTDANGYFGFKAANGEYTLTFAGGQIETTTRKIELYDADDDPPFTIAQAAVATGAERIGYGERTVAEALDFIAPRAPDSAAAVSKTIDKMRSGAPVTLVCYGDSITFGYQPGTGNQVAIPYPAALQARLRAGYGNASIAVINRGTSGWQSDEGLANLQDRVIAESPDMVLLMFGINDARGSMAGGAALTLDEYRTNMAAIVTALRAEGIEVVVMASTPIIDTTNAVNKKLLTYIAAAKDVAATHRVAFVDLQQEVRARFQSKAESPGTLLPDGIHFLDAKYAMIADIVMGKLLDFHNGASRLAVATREEFREPANKSPFVDTDCSLTYTNSGQAYGVNYVLRSDGTTGTYLRFSFYIEVPGMDLILCAPKNTNGGQAVVRDNGVALRTVDFYANESHVLNAEDVLIENMAQGYHVIEILAADIGKGSSSGATGNAYVEHFLFRPTRVRAAPKVYNRALAGALGSLESFRRIALGTLRFASAASTDTGALLLNCESAELKAGKTLVIEVEGKFFSGSGISWFGNPARGETDAENPSGANSGYLLYLEGTGARAVRLYRFVAANNFLPVLAEAAATVNYAGVQKMRITHTAAGVITVFFNDVQVIHVTDAIVKCGWFGLYTHFAGSMEISRFEYAYI
ncbi:SGNH/GDSL hydrolase family protein [Massilia timonae]|uniref:SGNH/GDSL hydrolase family protein n=1 Tax=Massilia timonae TaxID=47229 RepID=UPI0028ABAEFD|nr:GDSL-type esterase/lipase family protein [Massilia timonae]